MLQSSSRHGGLLVVFLMSQLSSRHGGLLVVFLMSQLSSRHGMTALHWGGVYIVRFNNGIVYIRHSAGCVRYRSLHQSVKHSFAPPGQLICIKGMSKCNYGAPSTNALSLDRIGCGLAKQKLCKHIFAIALALHYL